jgi:hypothetical protein
MDSKQNYSKVKSNQMRRQELDTIEKEMDSLRLIVNEVFEVEIMNKNRTRHVVDARMVFSKIIRDRGHTLTSIGRFLKKDHTSILHYVTVSNYILTQDNRLMDMYIVCKDRFLKDRDPIVSYTDNELVKTILMLRNQIDTLILERDNIKKMESKHIRFYNVINLIDKRVPEGQEKIIYRKINEILNG